ncbi:MAG: class I SAM-dependent methyltransferase [Bacteriovoracaceae bacterium]
MTNKNKNSDFPYLHGFSPKEQERLRKQADFAEYTVYKDVNFSSVKDLLEVGCGVGAQSEILLRRFPKLNLTGLDLNQSQLDAAQKHLQSLPYCKDRFKLMNMDASNMSFESNSYDGAFLCWILEHVPSPTRVLSEVRRVMKPGSWVYITEVMNSSFFLDPYSPNCWKYWMAFNDYQYENAGDPFIGAKLGNLLTSVGFRNIETNIKTWHLDNRYPEKRKEIIDYWTELLLSGADMLVNAKLVTEEVVKETEKELKLVSNDPNAVFMYSFMQAKAQVINY